MLECGEIKTNNIKIDYGKANYNNKSEPFRLPEKDIIYFSDLIKNEMGSGLYKNFILNEIKEYKKSINKSLKEIRIRKIRIAKNSRQIKRLQKELI